MEIKTRKGQKAKPTQIHKDKKKEAIKKAHKDRIKKRTLPELINECAVLLQKLVRLEDADGYGYCQCVSCGDKFHWKDMQGGHFIQRGKLATKLDRRNVNPQCKKCNGFGMKYDTECTIRYEHYINDTYGDGTVDELLLQSKQIKKYTREDLEELRHELKDKITKELNRLEAML